MESDLLDGTYRLYFFVENKNDALKATDWRRIGGLFYPKGRINIKYEK
jgi:hypothetical protein